MGYGYVAGFFRHHYGHGICSLRYAKNTERWRRPSVRGTSLSWLTGSMQPAATRRLCATIRAPSCKGEFLKNMFSISRVLILASIISPDFCVIIERHALLYHYEGACLAFRHTHTGVHYGHHPRQCRSVEFLLMMMEELGEKAPPAVRSKLHKENA